MYTTEELIKGTYSADKCIVDSGLKSNTAYMIVLTDPSGGEKKGIWGPIKLTTNSYNDPNSPVIDTNTIFDFVSVLDKPLENLAMTITKLDPAAKNNPGDFT